MSEYHEKIERIINLVEQYGTECQRDGFNDGYDEAVENSDMLIDEARKEAYDEAWDEARNKGYDEGWEDACQHILDKYIDRTGFVKTPTSLTDLSQSMETFNDNGSLCVMMYMNWLSSMVTELKVDKE